MSCSYRDETRRSSHRRIATGSTLGLCAVATLASTMALLPQLLIAGAIVLLLGLPHGALDAAVALKCARGIGRTRFFAGYLLLAGLMLAWILLHAPSALATFLLLSIVHFGLGDLGPDARGSGRYGLEALTRGCMPVLLPIAFHSEEVGRLFAWLAGLEVEFLTALTASLAPVCLQLLLACWAAWTLDLVLHRTGCARSFWELQGEVAVLTLSFWALPPLLSFAVYFGLWHSLRHLIALDVVLRDAREWDRARLLRAGAPLLLASAAAGGLAYALITTRAADPRALVQVLFFGLAVVTGPHMLMTAVVERALRVRDARPRPTPAPLRRAERPTLAPSEPR